MLYTSTAHQGIIGRESLEMVQMYTRSVTFNDSLEFYTQFTRRIVCQIGGKRHHWSDSKMSNITCLNLTTREQHILETMGLDTVEKIALSHRGDLGLGKGKGDDIITRARGVVAYSQIEAVVCSNDRICVILADTSKPTLVAVRHVLGIWDNLEMTVEGNQLIVSRPPVRPCITCGQDPVYICTVCWASLCRECRYRHDHEAYRVVEISYLEKLFDRVQEKAKQYAPTQRPLEQGNVANAVSDEELVSLAQQAGLAGFAEDFFFEIEGNDLMKKALACALFSTPEEPVHVLIVGDPAGGKSLARDIIAKKLGPEVELVGATATRAGLVCNLTTGERGILADSDGKIALVDEFDKIPDKDMEYCYELMAIGKCTIHSARIHEMIESHFVMIAFANPIQTVFGNEPINEIGFPPALLSRFALIVKAEELEADHRKRLLMRKVLGEAAASPSSRLHLAWLQEARKFQPRFVTSDEDIGRYIDKVDGIIEQYLSTPLRRDLRMGDYARRIPVAMARARFCDVDGTILEQAGQLMEDCILGWCR